MNVLDGMDAAELRSAVDEASEQVCRLADELLDALDSGDFAWEAGMRVALRSALEHRSRVRHQLKLAAVL